MQNLRDSSIATFGRDNGKFFPMAGLCNRSDAPRFDIRSTIVSVLRAGCDQTLEVGIIELAGEQARSPATLDDACARISRIGTLRTDESLAGDSNEYGPAPRMDGYGIVIAMTRVMRLAAHWADRARAYGKSSFGPCFVDDALPLGPMDGRLE